MVRAMPKWRRLQGVLCESLEPVAGAGHAGGGLVQARPTWAWPFPPIFAKSKSKSGTRPPRWPPASPGRSSPRALWATTSPTTPKPRRRRKLSTDGNHGSHVDEEGAPHIHPDAPRPFLKSRPSYAKDQASGVGGSRSGRKDGNRRRGTNYRRENHAPASGTWATSRVASTTTRGLSTSTENSALPGSQKSAAIPTTTRHNTVRVTVNTNSNE